MWIEGFQKRKTNEDINQKVLDINEELTDRQARESLAEFLRYNLGFAFSLLVGNHLKLLEIQELLINFLFEKDNSLVVAGRGFGKSFMIQVFCILYAIFNPNTKICIVANNFRAAKRIFDGIEKLVNHKKSFLLKHCFSNNPSKQPDAYKWTLLNGSELLALPLSNGEGLRGTRANVLIIDEALLISKEIQESVLRPFLTARQNITEQMEINAVEDEMIAQGVMKPEERTILSRNKLILMSSASYQFEYLFQEIYLPYIDYVMDEKQKKGTVEIEGDDKIVVKPSYAVARISYQAVPERSIMDESVIEAAKAGGEHNPHFQREYCAQFVDVSGAYFNIKHLHDCTHKDGDYPTIQLKGTSGAEYILAIDPSYSSSKNSDFFAMGVYLLDGDNKRITQVHTYAKAGGELKEHHEYLTYILTNFNIVHLVIDGSGTEFIDGYNESTIAKDRNLKLGYYTVDFESDNYEFEVRRARSQRNVSQRKFVYPQVFNSPSLRQMNEYLQTGINSNKVWFASRINANENALQAARGFQLPFSFKDKNDTVFKIQEFLDDQDLLIEITKRQVATVEVKAGNTGVLQFDLPAHLKKLTGENKPRKDNYTCLMMAYYASKHYFDIVYSKDTGEENTFVPFFV